MIASLPSKLDMAKSSIGTGNAGSNYTHLPMNSECLDAFNITEAEADYYKYSKSDSYLLTLFLPLLLVFGIVGNGLFIYVAVKIPHMRTITNRYLVSLSVADILFLGSAIGSKIWKYARSPVLGDETSLGQFGCVGVYFLSDVGYFASLIFVTLVSADRFVAVCRPQERHSFIKGKSMEIIGLCWLVSGFLAATLTPGNAHQQVFCMKWPQTDTYKGWPNVIRYCSPLQHLEWISSFANGLQTIPFLITFVLNVVLYVAIIRGLNQCIRRMSQHGVAKSKDAGMRNQIAKMLVVNGVVFFCLLAPFEIYSLFGMIAIFRTENHLAKYLIQNEDARMYILLVSQLLSYINSVVNPIIYSVMCRRYRQAFREALLPASCLERSLKKGSGPESCRTGAIPLEPTGPTETNDTNV
ncbi:neuromedin-U receptor 2-like [Amphiura filiformis]|uniref:neuromedin-U receptor 2-like n=1 Tax=Amphiura filiformis TaxID=82378 RepID=UPI003B221BA4